MFKNFNFVSIVSIIIIGLFVGVIFVYGASWMPPLTSPPNCPDGSLGCDAPINVSASNQTIQNTKTLNLGILKDKALILDGAFGVQGLSSFMGNVGIGVMPDPIFKLDVSGAYGIRGVSTGIPFNPIGGVGVSGKSTGFNGYGVYGSSDLGYAFYGDGPKSYFAGEVSVGGKLKIGNHIFLSEKERLSQIFYFRCSDAANWTNVNNCAWTYTDPNGVIHYTSGASGPRGGYYSPLNCDSPFPQPASGPSINVIQTVIDQMTTPATAPTITPLTYSTTNNDYEFDNFIVSISRINSWIGQNFCGGGGADGVFGNVTVDLVFPIIEAL